RSITAGELLTTAAWIRKFVTEHPAYQRDSRCTEAISSDLMAKCVEITQGSYRPDELLPCTSSKTSDTLPQVISDAELYLDNRPRRNAVEKTIQTTDSWLLQRRVIRALSHVAHRRAPGRFGGDRGPPPPRDAIKEEPIDSEEFNNGDGTDSAAAAAAAAAQLAASAASGPVHSVAKLSDSEQLARVLEQIEAFEAGPKRQASEIQGPVEADPEYQLIVEANNLAVKIDDEIHIIHRYCRDRYATRFPELETLVPSPVEYLQTVQQLGNEPLERSKCPGTLRPYLAPATIMVVSVTASTTQGVRLSDQELDWIMEACDMANKLLVQRERILSYVESRMQLIAPNLSAVVGASVAAKLLGSAGGLSALIRMPSCNIQVLGSTRKQLSGFSSATQGLHRGHLYECAAVRSLPPDLRSKAVRLIAAKCTLAARVDNFHQAPTTEQGSPAEHGIRIEVKPLTAPIDPPSKKRGGRRHRKMKERLGMTEMRKAANRINFGDVQDDAYQEDLGFSLGNLGRSSSGRIRAPVADAKTKARVSKALAQKLQRQEQQLQRHQLNQLHGGASTMRRPVSGTVSSVAFTPVQGLEIVNPRASERSAEEEGANAKYFGTKSTFFHVGTDLLGAARRAAGGPSTSGPAEIEGLGRRRLECVPQAGTVENELLCQADVAR
uniref:U4/U6 small nuclear ribonucleoprotein Prp31 n=1 Tax=Macrostomum lignano TaxID=282301 RepID=A0A1I8JMZ4_9PLAT